jgi:hypothetical protein
MEYLRFLRRLEFAFDYRKKLNALMEELGATRKTNFALYAELTEKVTKMHLDLGDSGEIFVLDRRWNIAIPRYQVLPEFLRKVRTAEQWFFEDDTIELRRFYEEAQSCDDMLIRYVGSLKDVIDAIRKQRFNMLRCFAAGVRHLVWFLPNLLDWFGIISTSMANKLKYNFVAKALTAIIALVGFLGSVVTVILGWEQTIEFLQNIIGVN